MLFQMVYLKVKTDVVKIYKNAVCLKTTGLRGVFQFPAYFQVRFESKVAHRDEENFLFRMLYFESIFVILERS